MYTTSSSNSRSSKTSMRRTRALVLIPVLLTVVTITFSVLQQGTLSGSVREEVNHEGFDRDHSFRALQGGGGGGGPRGGGDGGGVFELFELLYDVIWLGCNLGRLLGIGCGLGVMLCMCILLVLCITANDPDRKGSLVNAPGVRDTSVAQRVPRTSTRQKRTSKSVRKANLDWVHEGQDHGGPHAVKEGGEGLLANSGATTAADAAVYPNIPSGLWRGYYFQYGRQHSLFEFNLQFLTGHPTPTVRGFGADEVGEYTIRSGSFNLTNGRVCFTKKYRAGTGDRRENLGHCVEYRGTFAGSLAAGLRGSWFVATSRYTGEGTFHLWPSLFQVSPSAPMAIAVAIPTAEAVVVPSAVAAADLGNDVASAPSLAEVQANMVKPIGDTFVVDTECVVCFDANVGSCLRPCGHICMCMACAQKVGNCPICRAGIESVETYILDTGQTSNPVVAEEEFIPAAKFGGIRDGYFYMQGAQGLGYYSATSSYRA